MDFGGLEVEMEAMTQGLARLWARRTTLTMTPSVVHEEPSTELGTLETLLIPDDQDAEQSAACCQSVFLQVQSAIEAGPNVKEQRGGGGGGGGGGETIAGLDGEVQLCLNGSTLGDIPARYTVPVPREHELPAVGVWVHPHIVPGFKYRVRPLGNSGKQLFDGQALKLMSIGRGYARRLTFEPAPGALNENQNYFWTDSWPNGFGLELNLTTPGEEYTMLDANHDVVAHVTLVANIGSQSEIDHQVLSDGTIQKTATFSAMVKVIWIDQGHAPILLPINGRAIATKSFGATDSRVLRVTGLVLAGHVRRGFTLIPGISEHCRQVTVDGTSIGDVPTRYTVDGLESYEFPIVGTYVDPRILPGFKYKVRVLDSKHRHLFNGRALRLESIGAGYGKRLTFESDSNTLNSPNNYLWSDTHPDGLGLETRAVETGTSFTVVVNDRQVGTAVVFRTDAPQREESQKIVRERNCLTRVIKRVRVEVTCFVTLDGELETQAMRVTGTAVLVKAQKERSAKLLLIENVALDSQVNLLYTLQEAPVTFHPVK